MAITPGIVQLQADGVGKKVDTTELTVGANTVERQVVVFGDPQTAANYAAVTANGELTVTFKDVIPTPQNITVADAASATTTGANGQSIITGTATAASTAFQTVSGDSSFAIQITGTWVGTLQFERSLDSGTTWTGVAAFSAGTNYSTSTVTANGSFHGNASAATTIRVRATAFTSGTAVIKILAGGGTGTITVGNPLRLFDQVSGAQATIKPASTPAATTDTALVVALSPNNSLTVGAPVDTVYSGTISAYDAVNNTPTVTTNGQLINGSAPTAGSFILVTLTGGETSAIVTQRQLAGTAGIGLVELSYDSTDGVNGTWFFQNYRLIGGNAGASSPDLMAPSLSVVGPTLAAKYTFTGAKYLRYRNWYGYSSGPSYSVNIRVSKTTGGVTVDTSLPPGTAMLGGMYIGTNPGAAGLTSTTPVGTETGLIVRQAGAITTSPPQDTVQTGTITATDSAVGTAANYSVALALAPTPSSYTSFLVPFATQTCILVLSGYFTAGYFMERSNDSTDGSNGTWLACAARSGAVGLEGYTVQITSVGTPAIIDLVGAKYLRVRNAAGIYTGGTTTVTARFSSAINGLAIRGLVSVSGPIGLSGLGQTIANSTTSTPLGANAVYTPFTSDDVGNFATAAIVVYTNVASALNGLSIQQSSDNINWDVTDTYTMPAMAAGGAKQYSVGLTARYFRVSYTNGPVAQTTFRLSVKFYQTEIKASSIRMQDGRDNENDVEEVAAYNSMFNPITLAWDRMRGDATNGLYVTAQNTIAEARYGFGATYASSVDTTRFTLVKLGANMTISQTGGNLNIGTLTTANSETVLRSTTPVSDDWVARFKLQLTQRIANQNFYFELVDVQGDNLAYTNTTTTVTVTWPTGTNPFTALTSVGQTVYLGAFTSSSGLVIPNRYPIASVSGDTTTFTVTGATAGAGTLSVFGLNFHHTLFNGTVGTSALYDTGKTGYFSGDTTITTQNTAAPGLLLTMVQQDGRANVLDSLGTSSTVLENARRASRVQSVPAGSVQLYAQIRVLNGSTAPASTTTLTMGQFDIEQTQTTMPVQIVGISPMGVNASLPVEIMNTPAVTVGGSVLLAAGASAIGSVSVSNALTCNFNAGSNLVGDVSMFARATANGLTLQKVLATASTNATLVKASAGRLYRITLFNTATSARFIKIYNLAVAPTPASSAVFFTMMIPANGGIDIDPPFGIFMSTGIAFAVTTGSSETDATATAANDVMGMLLYA